MIYGYFGDIEYLKLQSEVMKHLAMNLLKTWNLYNYSVHKNVSVHGITTKFI
jgi:hypothetical protein